LELLFWEIHLIITKPENFFIPYNIRIKISSVPKEELFPQKFQDFKLLEKSFSGIKQVGGIWNNHPLFRHQESCLLPEDPPESMARFHEKISAGIIP